ncbi:peroxisomal N(1)-acetyl-spermine/spermidine oxidase-like isoform X1 [Macrosteles quadrilineatus]|uniref:peroxisomal N(1)-acetyl-spermine/spermidine oxidase-like isoform X1 n=1 Tax=Macrosteles quadrilineatus TaxID=74068 RepID=UPI0023E0D468|nr:peroxisomal N(1)-acetyl-spermine/spermidine oxidase-like isoform X1 [Macrosteles quadrilineatus]
MASSDADLTFKKCKIIIIGAGMAGLSAANHLIKNGESDFVVLEARKRVGGRIVSIRVDENKFELGANWIHGVLGNPMYEIAMANNLIDIIHVPKPHKVVAAMEDGKQVSFKTLQEIYEAYMCFLHRCEEYFLCQYLPPEGINSVGEHIMLEAAMYLDRVADPEDRRIKSLIFDCLLKRETCISGCDSMNEIDLLELGSYTELQGGNIILPSGYSSILDPVCQVIPPEKLLTEHSVTSVRWRHHDSGVSDQGNESDDSDRTVTEEPLVSEHSYTSDRRSSSIKKTKDLNKPKVEVCCENGVKVIGESVICTIPLGVLKEYADNLFIPPLPQYKTEAFERLLFGTVNKIFLVYERPFLNQDISEVMLLWNATGAPKNEDLSDCWFKKIYSFSKVTETVLLGWVSGKEAEYMETLSQDQIADICTQILRKFLNDPFVPRPKLCVCTHWHKEKFTRGSYTAIAVGATQADIENIAQPLYASPLHNKPAVLFAGEHTHSSFYSTVHGAYLTGRTAATLLLSPDSAEPNEMVIECDQTNDLSSWIQGISLD